ncbi:MAG: hypothetical protein CMN78_05240 [Spirochaetales bacterium]|nr:hypothetical protein [Spirochaetales bacterium]
MILVVGQNSAWQNTYLLPDMLPGKVNRVTGVTRSAAGKGANLSRGLNFLGKTPHLLAYAGGHIGGQFTVACDRDGIRKTIVPISSETRMCTTVLSKAGIATEIVEPAPEINEREAGEFLKAFLALLPQAKCLAIAGTAVDGDTPDCYLQYALRAKEHNIPVFLDSYREHGKVALAAGPDILKINNDELADLTGMPVDSRQDRENACTSIREDFGIRWIIITLGENGAEGFSAAAGIVASPPAISAKNPIGSGDVFSSGVISSMLDSGFSWDLDCLEQSIRLAVAMGTANCISLKTGHVERAHLRSILPKVEVQRHLTAR